jgi:hypothetical protein
MQSSKTLYKHSSLPYYIYAPRWIDSSAGIKVLHYLCHALNQIGQEAYIVLSDPYFRTQPRINGKLNTPILTQEQAKMHVDSGRNPIVIYSETVKGNPLKSQNVVRYLLNYSGALGGNEYFPENELVISFSKNIAMDHAIKADVQQSGILFLPPVDMNEFKLSTLKKPFQLVYAGKYRSFVGTPPEVGDLPSIEIFRDGREMQTREEVKKLLSEATVLYCFENSSIITESILSGTPVLLVSNPFLGNVIAEHELGWGGMRLYGEEDALSKAKNSILEGTEKYSASLELFWSSLEDFTEKSQRYFVSNSKGEGIVIKDSRIIFLGHKMNLAFQIFQSKGARVLIGMTIHYFKRRMGLRLSKKRKSK